MCLLPYSHFLRLHAFCLIRTLLFQYMVFPSSSNVPSVLTSIFLEIFTFSHRFTCDIRVFAYWQGPLLSEDNLWTIFMQLLGALAAIHAVGCAYRILSPASVLVCAFVSERRGEGEPDFSPDFFSQIFVFILRGPDFLYLLSYFVCIFAASFRKINSFANIV